jgi:hypothetical protein
MDNRVFELRTYHAVPGKMAALHQRFREHTCRLLQKHGLTLLGFWVPLEAGESEKRLVYLVAYPSREAAERSWAAFRVDPEWQAVKEASERDGQIVERIESVFLSPTDYSALR